MGVSKKLSSVLKKQELARWDYVTQSRPPKQLAVELAGLALAQYELCETGSTYAILFNDMAGMPAARKPPEDKLHQMVEKELYWHQCKHKGIGRLHKIRQLWATKETLAAWEKARAQNDFEIVRPAFQRAMTLERRAFNETEKKYFSGDGFMSVVLDKATKGMTAELYRNLSSGLRGFSRNLLEKERTRQATQRYLHDDAFHMSEADQEKLVYRLLADTGYDFGRGKVAPSPHPLCLGRNDDVRIGYRINTDNFLNTLLSTMHEAGHAFYRQNLPEAYKDYLVGGIAGGMTDEAMALFFENIILRTRAGARYIYDLVSREIGEPYSTRLRPDMIYKHMMRLEPQGIRANVDEVRYPLDLLHRYDMVFSSHISLRDGYNLREDWNAMYDYYTGFEPANDNEGILQDIHLYAGESPWLTSYLPGRLAASQYAEACFAAHPAFGKTLGMDGGLGRNLEALAPVKDWLKRNICDAGARYEAVRLVERVTQQCFSADAYKKQLTDKYAPPHMPQVASSMSCSF